MISSDIKIIDYLKRLLKENATIELNGLTHTFTKKDKIVIKGSFFLKDKCSQCGACCKDFGNAYFVTEYDNITDEELKNSLTELPIIINGKDKLIYYSRPLPISKLRIMNVHGRVVRACRYCVGDNGKTFCRIHKERGFTCKFPHIRIHEGKNSASLSLGEYGRNWALKCPIKFKDKSDLINKDELRNRIDFLKDFYEKSKYLELETFLPEIISALEKVLDEGIEYKDIVIRK